MKYPPAPLTPFFASLLCIRRRTHMPSESREPKDLNHLSVNATTACSLFALSLQRFRPLTCLFSTACSLFSENTRGGGIRVVSAWRGTRLCSLDRLNALSPLPPITSLQTLHFHAFTHSFAHRWPAKPLFPQALTRSFHHHASVSPSCSGGQRCYLQ